MPKGILKSGTERNPSGILKIDTTKGVSKNTSSTLFENKRENRGILRQKKKRVRNDTNEILQVSEKAVKSERVPKGFYIDAKGIKHKVEEKKNRYDTGDILSSPEKKKED